MTKHPEFSGRSSSIMEPVDETPSLLTDALIDAMNSDTLPTMPQQPSTDPAPQLFQHLHNPPQQYAPPFAPHTAQSPLRATKSFDYTGPEYLYYVPPTAHHPHHLQQTLDNSGAAISPHVVQHMRSAGDGCRKKIYTDDDADTLADQMSSINMHYEKSFMLLDANEEMIIHNVDMFVKKLGCAVDAKLKVVSIFGNTGDGKSHTMNHTLFGGQEIFRTSSAQDSCTMGVWAAHQAELGVLCLDTEGLLGVTDTNNLRLRLLLKVLAISDVIIFRTRAERLHSDMYTFLGSASRAYSLHFSAALQAMGLPGSAQTLGPAVIVFHETRSTQVMEPNDASSAEDNLRERFAAMQLNLESFSSLKYIGIRTEYPPTNYDKMLNALHAEILNTTVRSPRTPNVIYRALQALNRKFSGQLSEKIVNPFPEEYFTCGEHCQSCNERCDVSMGHLAEGIDHANGKPCRYQHQFENKEDMCRRCYENGRKEVVTLTVISNNESSWLGLARYAWSGSVIVCPNCGEIYRSRQHWYGNQHPEDYAIRTEIRHVWGNQPALVDGPLYSAQKVLDHVNYISGTVCSLGAEPSKLLTGWISDRINPAYWKPNSEIVKCHQCSVSFGATTVTTAGGGGSNGSGSSALRKHHCRGCGLGFCAGCSLYKRPVPGRGWHEPVRVCGSCKEILFRDPNAVPGAQHAAVASTSAAASVRAHGSNSMGCGLPNDEQDLMPRKYGEVLMSTLSTVSAAVEYSKDLIKDTARPSYWIPDSESPNCAICKLPFGTAEELTAAASPHHRNQHGGNMYDRLRHHCRACGLAVCNPCSLARMPVPERGWPGDVRVCDDCAQRPRLGYH